MVGKWGSCSGKKRFATYDLAENARREYNDRVAMQFGEFQAFWCKHHEAWHLGHWKSGLIPKRLGISDKRKQEGTNGTE